MGEIPTWTSQEVRDKSKHPSAMLTHGRREHPRRPVKTAGNARTSVRGSPMKVVGATRQPFDALWGVDAADAASTCIRSLD